MKIRKKMQYETQWSANGFIKRFNELRANYKNRAECYRAAELEHTKLFGRRRYSSNDSFKSVLKKYA